MPANLLINHCTGVPKIDDEHSKIFDVIDQIETTLGPINNLLCFLIKMLNEHHSAEEDVMSCYPYTLHKEHANDHASIVMKIAMAKKDALRQLVSTHVEQYDLPFAHYLHSRDTFTKARFRNRKSIT